MVVQAVRHGLQRAGTVMAAPHAPLPMLSQLSERAPIDVEFLVEGPTEWHVRLTRLAAAAV